MASAAAVLRTGLEAHRRAREAPEAIKRDGMTLPGRDDRRSRTHCWRPSGTRMPRSDRDKEEAPVGSSEDTGASLRRTVSAGLVPMHAT
jgi:hypothetical protein